MAGRRNTTTRRLREQTGNPNLPVVPRQRVSAAARRAKALEVRLQTAETPSGQVGACADALRSVLAKLPPHLAAEYANRIVADLRRHLDDATRPRGEEVA